MTRRNAQLLVLMMAAYALAYFTFMRLPGDIIGSPIAGSDLSSYYTAGRLVLEGQGSRLYDVAPGDAILGDATAGPYRDAADRLGLPRQHYYIYPPFFALVVSPLSLLPFSVARFAWLAADMMLIGLTIWLYARWRRLDGTPPAPLEWGLFVITLGLEFLPLIWALAIGQTSLLLLALLVGAIVLVKRDAQIAAGALLGLATAIKLTPALLVLYFAWRGRRRAAVSATVCFLVCSMVAVAALGMEVNMRFFTEVAPAMSGGTAYFLNQSLTGLFDRALGAGDVRQVALESVPAARALAMLAGLGLVAATAIAFARRNRWHDRGRPGPAPTGMALDLEISLVLLLTLILSPISWSHHYVLAMIPLYTIVAAAARCGRASPALAVSLGVAFLLIARKPHPDLFLHGPARLALSATLGGALLLWIAGVILLGWGPTRPERKSGVARAA